MRKRLPTLLVPFFVISLVLYIERIFLGNGVSISKFLYGFISLRPLDGTFWYVYVILLFYIVFYFSARTSKTNKGLIVKSFIAIVCFVTACIYFNMSYWWYLSSFGFIIGMLYSIFDEKITQFIDKKYFRWLIFSFVGFIFFYEILGSKGYYYDRVFIIQIPMVLFIMAFLILCIRYKFNSKILSFLGEISYELYLSQSIVFALLSTYIYPGTLYFLLVFIIIIPLSYALNKIHKFILKHVFKI